jgi:hypothetical protein
LRVDPVRLNPAETGCFRVGLAHDWRTACERGAVSAASTTRELRDPVRRSREPDLAGASGVSVVRGDDVRTPLYVFAVPISLVPLFPVEDVRRATAGRAPLDGATRQGDVSPIAAVYGFVGDQPAIAVELAFYPIGDAPEFLADESWLGYREGFGLTPLGESAREDGWRLEFGPHALVSNPVRRLQFVIPRPDAEWEAAAAAYGSCSVVLGSGLCVDHETGAVVMPRRAAALVAAYAGSWPVPELADIPGLHVVSMNSFRPYNPIRPVSLVLDADVVIALQRLCFQPERLGEKAEAVRHLTANLLGRDLLPGPALGQLHQPTRTTLRPRAAQEAHAAIELLMSLGRAEVMDECRPPAVFDPGRKREISGAADLPQMLWLYAAVLRLRQLWDPSQSLPQRAESFEAFMRWLRFDLRLNAALLVQVAFNLWIADDDAQRQASRLLRFRARPVTDATLGKLWGTACDLFLVSGQVDALGVPGVIDTVILTFDAGLAGMRDFFEHVDVAEIASSTGAEMGYAWNSRLKANFHPRLEHKRSQVAKLAADLHRDMFIRLEEKDAAAYDVKRLVALVEREEQLVRGSR